MNDYRAFVESDYNSIYHHGVKGQKWGVRRYQNPDGSLTAEGKARYRSDPKFRQKVDAMRSSQRSGGSVPSGRSRGGVNGKKMVRRAVVGGAVAAGLTLGAIYLGSKHAAGLSSAGRKFLTDSHGMESIKNNLDWDNAKWVYQSGVNDLMVRGRRYAGRQLRLPG